MSDPLTTSYDELPYDDHVFGYAQPANLATVAALHGLDPPPLDRCRVLDLGCATGANLLPMAVARPGAELVGVDLSPRQIAQGRETVARLGLTNVTLHARNVLDPTDDLGAFDYIICHGIYSWVPPAVQEGLLNVIHRHLGPGGLAYVSYNTYPGWHLRGMARDALRFHATGVSGGPAERTAQAKAFLDFLVEALPEQDTAYANILCREAAYLRDLPDSYVFHEHLETDNRPVYFHEFAAHAAGHGLQYLAEASPQPLPGNLKPGTLEALAGLGADRLRMEQYLDFIRCRVFRRSVLCHATVRPDRDGMVDRIPALAISSPAKPEAEAPNPDPAARETFIVSDNVQFATADAPLRAALWRAWQARPAAVPFADLHAAAGGPPRELADGLLQLYLAAVIDLHLHPPALVTSPGARPCASPFARLQAERGDKRVYSLSHNGIDPDPFARFLLPLLDGAHTRAELVDLLAARAAAGEFVVHDGAGQTITDAALVRPALTDWIESALDRLAKTGLLNA
jgi:SAM-dependent methyltransferase